MDSEQSESNAEARRIGQRMRLYRNRANPRISQEEAAHRMGVAVRSYARWERGENTGHLSRIEEIAEMLGVTPADLQDDYVPADVNEKLDVLIAEVRAMRADLRAAGIPPGAKADADAA